MWRRGGGPRTDPWETPVPNWSALDTSPPQAHPERPTSEIGFKPAKWNPSDYPVMRGWTGGSDDWQYQKWQTDPAEWGLMILESAFAIRMASVTDSSAVSVEWLLLKPDCLAVAVCCSVERNNETWLKNNSFECFGYEWKERDSLKFSIREVFNVVFWAVG